MPKLSITCQIMIRYINGDREGSLTLFEENRFPFGCIGLVDFLWSPKGVKISKLPNFESGKSEIDTFDISSFRQLWIWSHPTSFQSIWQLLNKISPKHNGLQILNDIFDIRHYVTLEIFKKKKSANSFLQRSIQSFRIEGTKIYNDVT